MMNEKMMALDFVELNDEELQATIGGGIDWGVVAEFGMETAVFVAENPEFLAFLLA
ncbi:MAG: bacteriocin [Streptococcaceae bacterium]|nr:bacteriocin [Streptococcaceae bacterium]